MPALETSRLILRPWRETDREPFYRLNSAPAVMRYFPSVLSRPESDALVDRILSDFSRHGFGLSAAELRATNEFIGYIGLSVPGFEAPFLPAVEIGWRLDARFWNRGLATEGARAVLAYAFEALRLPEVVSFTVPANLPSRRVMEKIGMARDVDADFDHPALPQGHPLRRHVLYRAGAKLFLGGSEK